MAEEDGIGTRVRMEQEPGASGKYVITDFKRVLDGFAFSGFRVSKDKDVFIGAFAAAAERGAIKLVEGDWIEAFLEEVTAYPYGAHDDQLDAVAKCYSILALTKKAGAFGREYRSKNEMIAERERKWRKKEMAEILPELKAAIEIERMRGTRRVVASEKPDGWHNLWGLF